MTNSMDGINTNFLISDYLAVPNANNIGLIYSAVSFVTELNTKASYRAVTNADIKAEAPNSQNSAVQEKITMEDLKSNLHNLISENSETNDNSDEINHIQGLISNFDRLSNGNNYITSLSGNTTPTEIQDPLTVTSSQLASPIDLRV